MILKKLNVLKYKQFNNANNMILNNLSKIQLQIVLNVFRNITIKMEFVIKDKIMIYFVLNLILQKIIVQNVQVIILFLLIKNTVKFFHKVFINVQTIQIIKIVNFVNKIFILVKINVYLQIKQILYKIVMLTVMNKNV